MSSISVGPSKLSVPLNFVWPPVFLSSSRLAVACSLFKPQPYHITAEASERDFGKAEKANPELAIGGNLLHPTPQHNYIRRHSDSRECQSMRLGSRYVVVRSVSVDLNTDLSLQIDIPDALSERDKVKFTVHTKTTLSTFQNPEFSVTRQHEDFIWLHDTLIETEEYAGIIIPPAPAKPDFEGPREKMQKLGEGEGSMTKDEFAKMKQELEAEYLAVFKKTVSVHEVFLQRLSSHPVLSKDHNFHIFLEYDQDLTVRRKNTKEMFGGFFKSMVKTADEVLYSGAKAIGLSIFDLP
ncbi:sorting nexin-5 [Pelobates cultripes]|uniref:Sorting nexin-5 n=1 Tax=Pelobates cultripes TaxID=61616 RepID=A0AAD1VS01_PELCU|nr:sorting nexin-5 [Pelobates cultripes]